MWFYDALFFAVWSAISVFIIKKLTVKIPPSPLLLFSFLFTLPWMLLIILLTGGFPKVEPSFFLFMLASAILDILAFSWYYKSIKISPISLVGPISSFSPVFTTIIALFTLHEIPNNLKLLGIVLVVIGSYLLNLKDVKKGIFIPLVMLFKNKGITLALYANFLWALTPIFQKQAIFQTHPTSPLVASFMGFVLATLYFLVTNLKSFKKYKTDIKNNLPLFIIFGVGGAIAQLAAYSAFEQSNLGYVTAVMKLSGLFTVIIGGLFLRKKL